MMLSKRSLLSVGVPLPGTWDGGFWCADDIAALPDGSDVLSWPAREGGTAWTGSAGTTLQYSSNGYLGKPCVVGTPTGRMFANAKAALFAGLAQPISVWVDCIPTVGGVSSTIFCLSRSSSTTGFLTLTFNTSNNIVSSRDSDSNVNVNVTYTDGSTGGASSIIIGSRQLIGMASNGTSNTLINDVRLGPLGFPTSQSVATQTFNQMVLGNLFRTAASNPFQGLFRAIGVRTGLMSLSDFTACRAWSYGSPVRIGWFGDSKTAGTGSTATNRSSGWRFPVWQWSSARNMNVEHVGTMNQGTFAHPFADGNSGFDIAGISGAFSTAYAGGLRADVYVVDAGTNNMGAGSTAYSSTLTPAAYLALLNNIEATDPGKVIVSCNVIPINPGTQPTPSANVNDFNPRLALVQDTFDALPARAGNPLIRVDSNTAIGGPAYVAGNYFDSFHPDDVGYQFIANAIIAKVANLFSSYGTQ